MLRNLNQSDARGRTLGTNKVGYPGAQFPSSGVHGPAIAYNDSLDPAKLYAIRLLTFPATGVLEMSEKTDFAFTPEVDGVVTMTYVLVEDGVDLPGTGTVSLQSGVVTTTINCTVGNAVAAGIAASLQQYGNTVINCGVGNGVAAGVTAAVTQNVVVACVVGSAIAAGITASIQQDGLTTINCSVGAASAAGVTAAINQSGLVTINCTVGNATAAGVMATISFISGDYMPSADRTLVISLDEFIASPPLMSKTEGEVLDYTFDWTRKLQLAGDTIASFDVTIEGTVQEGTNIENGTLVSVWTDGGTLGTESLISCRITTLQGRTYIRSLRLRVVAAR